MASLHELLELANERLRQQRLEANLGPVLRSVPEQTEEQQLLIAPLRHRLEGDSDGIQGRLRILETR